MNVEQLLRTVPGFGALGDPDRAAIASALSIEKLPVGRELVREGAKGDTIYLVLEGEIEVTRRQGGARHALNRMKPGDLFGLVALIDDGARSASCTTLTAAVVGALPRQVFTLLFNNHEAIAFAFQEALGIQLARDFRNLDANLRAAIGG